MKTTVSILILLLLLASNWLYIVFLFKRDYFRSILKGFFQGRELLALLIHFLSLVISAITISEIWSERYTAFFIAKWFLEVSLMGFTVLCFTAFPYKVLTRGYSRWIKVLGVIGGVVIGLLAFGLLFGLAWERIRW